MQLTLIFAAALKHYRLLYGISQEQIASTAGIDRTYVSQLERGIKSPTLTTIEKIANCFKLDPRYLLRFPNEAVGPRFPTDYVVRDTQHIQFSREEKNQHENLDVSLVTDAVNVTHDLIDDFYKSNLDVAAILGLRNLSAFIGELFAAGMAKNKTVMSNPHQDGYPDLLLMDSLGRAHWEKVRELSNHKKPFSPFLSGGIEVKATCGSVLTPKECAKRNLDRPNMGDTRIHVLTGYDWKAHHRETNNLVGIFWDFIDKRPTIVGVFYSNSLSKEDWGKIVQPKTGGGRTTSVSIMNSMGIRKMYSGWLCVLKQGRYREYLNKRNKGDLIPY